MIGAELEQLLRRLIREEIARALGNEPVAASEADLSDVEQRAAARAAELRAVRAKRGAR